MTSDLNTDMCTMNSICLHGVFLGDRKCDVLIEDGRISGIGEIPPGRAAQDVDAGGLAILPAFYNTHCHAAMSLLRGYADDMPLQKWLQEYIWPYEEKLSPDDIEKGSALAADEMISGGSVFFNDMYFDIDRTVRAVDESGMRACIGITVMENHPPAVEEDKKAFVRNWKDPSGGRIQLAIAPHSVYTVGREKLIRSAEWARKEGLKIHIHVSETRKEVEDCTRTFGASPVRYLDSIGFLGPDVIAAHCVHVDEEEWDILAERGVTVSHCPCSNMKLGSGRFPYELAIRSGARISLGTDGCSSNNNLDMREEMKFAALLAKSAGNPELLPAEEVMKWACLNGAAAFGIDGGMIAEGKSADFILADLDDPRMRPCHNLVSNWVYAASDRCIRAVCCNGKFLRDFKKGQ